MAKNILLSLSACLLVAFLGQAFAENSKEMLRGQIQIPEMKEVMLKVGEARRGELDGSDIKMIVWNMYKGDKPNWAVDYKKIAYNNDILVLQEMYLDEKMETVFNAHSVRILRYLYAIVAETIGFHNNVLIIVSKKLVNQ